LLSLSLRLAISLATTTAAVAAAAIPAITITITIAIAIAIVIAVAILSPLLLSALMPFYASSFDILSKLYFLQRRGCFFWRGPYDFVCVGGFANKRENCTYNSVYYVRRGETNKNTHNITFFWENVLVPLYRYMLSFVEIQHRSYS
jgi:hypothetical protein